MDEIGWLGEKRDFTSIVRYGHFHGTNSAEKMGSGGQISRGGYIRMSAEEEKSGAEAVVDPFSGAGSGSAFCGDWREIFCRYWICPEYARMHMTAQTV